MNNVTGGEELLPNTNFKCERYDKDCHSKIGFFSHQRCCSINPGTNPESHRTDGGRQQITMGIHYEYADSYKIK